MRLYEYEAKAIFNRFGIPIPQGWLVSTSKDARNAVSKLSRPAVLKAQLLIGGRGKSGGIRFVKTPEEAEEEAEKLFKTEIGGLKVTKLLIEEKIDIVKELYLSVSVDSTYGSPIVMASSEGGVDIEDIARIHPEKIIMFRPDIIKGLREHEARRILKQVGLSGSILIEATNILCRLYQVFRAYDAEIAEINPLAVTNDRKVIAIDARLNVDDHALFRHPELEALRGERFENPLELEGHRRGVNYVDLKGNIAVMGNGAGLVMMLLDAIKIYGGQPACFLDAGGGMTAQRVENALDLLLMKAERDRDVKVIFFAFWFMISPAEETTKGFLNAISKRRPQIPIIGVIQGVGAQQAAETLRKAGIKCYPTIEDGIKAAIEIAKG
ncbi:MAG: acetate--CoA ligase family protein [Candidatus Nezhaarchaeota archaeon]|nr:acetate--CoA ligase family protein [Candidatus Nezhaarchaeota archaeon]MCX8142512.1 acetate--CoA ligase family protein [Candidatus Nezhaarchaeota archaeon]MDW8050515.1 ATP-grasp domain-containing protein [Nitrososphaerota archaeon]